MSSTGLVQQAQLAPHRAASHSLNLVEEIKIGEPIRQLLGRPEEGQWDLGSKFLKGSNHPQVLML